MAGRCAMLTAGDAAKVVSEVELVPRLADVLVRVGAHRTRLGVVKSASNVQIEQVSARERCEPADLSAAISMPTSRQLPDMTVPVHCTAVARPGRAACADALGSVLADTEVTHGHLSTGGATLVTS